MKQTKALILCFFIGIALLAGLGFKTPITNAQTTKMRVVPGIVTANSGENITINVAIEDVTEMFGYEFRLFWNASILESNQWNYTSKTWIQDPNSPPSQWGPNFFVAANSIIDVGDGRSRYWLSLTAMPPANPVSGTFNVVTLTFRVIGEGATLLDLGITTIGNMFGEAIPHTVVDGFFTTIRRDSAVTKVQPRSPLVTQNSTVRIDVDATNYGEVPENFTVFAYANNTATSVLSPIGSQAVVNLAPQTSQSLVFLWNTMGIEIGTYQIFANATIVERDVDATNNQLVDGTIEVTMLIVRDFAVTGMTANSTLFAQSETAMIIVILENKGSIDEQNLSLTVYYNNTFLGSGLTSEVYSGDQIEQVFNWSTADKLGDYVLRANVTIIENETDVTNNEMVMILVVTEAPIAEFTFSPAEPLKNTEVTFDASASSDPDGTIVSYTWNFGETYMVGSSNISTYVGHGMVVKYAYTHEGTFIVTLTVTDNKGLNYTVSRALTYSSRTEKNVTVVGVSSLSIPPVVLDAITAVIVIVVLVAVYMKLIRKPKPKIKS